MNPKTKGITMIKIITETTMKEFSDKIEIAERNFFPMLGYRKLSFHDRLLSNHKISNKTFNEKTPYMKNHWRIIDELDHNEYCLYHLFTTPGNSDLLQATLILPSSFENRRRIVSTSMDNLITWASKEINCKQLKLQVLEYGEIQLYPTMASYLISVMEDKGAAFEYPLYLKIDSESTIADTKLDEKYKIISGLDNDIEELIAFYEDELDDYFIVDTKEEILEMSKTDLFKDTLITIRNQDGKIIGAAFGDKDHEGKMWIDNLAIHSAYNEEELGIYLIKQIVTKLRRRIVDESIYVYSFREFKTSIENYEKSGFVGFEYWTDMYLYIR